MIRRRFTAGFTIMELLVVVGLIAAFAVIVAMPLAGSGKSVALQSAQAMISNLISGSRARAISTNTEVRLLFRAAPELPDYRRLIVLIAKKSDGSWEAVDSYFLPNGTYVLPYKSRILSGSFDEDDKWKVSDSEYLGSSALNNSLFSFAFDAGVEAWEYIAFTPRGTVDGAGSLILALGRPRSPAEAVGGGSPIVLGSPDAIRGVQVSSYGVPRLLDGRDALN